MPSDSGQEQAKANNSTGQRGEEAATRYLVRQGCSILARNWRAGHGEIDIIVHCPPEATTPSYAGSSMEAPRTMLAFVEVRTRHGRAGLAEESISKRKATSMAAAAYSYMAEHDLDPDATAWRIDLVGISMSSTGITSINWIKGALDESMVLGEE